MAKGLLLIIGFSTFVSIIKGGIFDSFTPAKIGGMAPEGSVGAAGKMFGGVSGLVGVDMEPLTDIACRKGFKSFAGDSYSNFYVECSQAMKSQPNNGTNECIHICLWRKLDWVDPASETIKRKQIEDKMKEVFPGEEGRPMAESITEDFETCFKQTKATANYDNDGCKGNLDFSKCFKEKADKACNRGTNPATDVSKPAEANNTTLVPPHSEQNMTLGGLTAATPPEQIHVAMVGTAGNPVTAAPPAQNSVAPNATAGPVTAASTAQIPTAIFATSGNPMTSTPPAKM